jgi:hypothetical protein
MPMSLNALSFTGEICSWAATMNPDAFLPDSGNRRFLASVEMTKGKNFGGIGDFVNSCQYGEIARLAPGSWNDWKYEVGSDVPFSLCKLLD